MPEMTMAEMKDDIERRGALEGAEVLARLHPVAPENRPFFIDHTLEYEHRSFVVRHATHGSRARPQYRRAALQPCSPAALQPCSRSFLRPGGGASQRPLRRSYAPRPRPKRRARGARGGGRDARQTAPLQIASAPVDKLILAMREALGKFAVVSCGRDATKFPEWCKTAWADMLRSCGFSFKRMAAPPAQVPRTLVRGYGANALHFPSSAMWYENAQEDWEGLIQDYANPSRVFERWMRARRARQTASGQSEPMPTFDEAQGVRTSA